MPIAPAHGQIMCSCDKYQQASITVLEVKVNKTAMITQNQDTSNINLITLMTILGADVQQLSISPNTYTESDFITANFLYTDKRERKEQFHVNVTLIDKCGQQSSPVVIERKPCKIHVKGTIFIKHKNIDSCDLPGYLYVDSGKSSKTSQEYWIPILVTVVFTIICITFCKY